MKRSVKPVAQLPRRLKAPSTTTRTYDGITVELMEYPGTWCRAWESVEVKSAERYRRAMAYRSVQTSVRKNHDGLFDVYCKWDPE